MDKRNSYTTARIADGSYTANAGYVGVKHLPESPGTFAVYTGSSAKSEGFLGLKRESELDRFCI